MCVGTFRFYPSTVYMKQINEKSELGTPNKHYIRNPEKVTYKPIYVPINVYSKKKKNSF